VAQNLAQGAAVAAADDGHVARPIMCKERRVAHHFVVEEIVPAAEHGGTVNGHEMTEGFGVPDLDHLPGGGHPFELALDPQAKGGAGTVEVLEKPFFRIETHSRLRGLARAHCSR